MQRGNLTNRSGKRESHFVVSWKDNARSTRIYLYVVVAAVSPDLRERGELLESIDARDQEVTMRPFWEN